MKIKQHHLSLDENIAYLRYGVSSNMMK